MEELIMGEFPAAYDVTVARAMEDYEERGWVAIVSGDYTTTYYDACARRDESRRLDEERIQRRLRGFR